MTGVAWLIPYCARPASTPSTPARNDQSCVRDARARESARPLRSGSTKRFPHSLPSILRDDLLGDLLGNRFVSVKLHAVGGAALGARTEIRRIAEHLAQRNGRLDR